MKRIGTLLGLAGLLALGAAGCSGPSGPGAPGVRYESAEKAVEALIAALRAGDMDAATGILGGGADAILHSGDAVADKNGIAEFVASYDEAHRLEPAPDGGMLLIAGKTEWPMPIPIVEEGGSWSFDTEAGVDEILSRRIGRNELDAVQVCLAIVDAQNEFASSDPDGDGVQEYAQKFRSDDGKRDGLFWPAKEGEPQSPLGELVAEAAVLGYGPRAAGEKGSRPYRGYHYRILKSQGPGAEGGAFDYVVNGRMIGGFAVIAYPADYANSGIASFLVNHAGVVYEKDLGELTPEMARGIEAYDPSRGWRKVE